MSDLRPGMRYRLRNEPSSNAPSVETLEQAVELDRMVEKEVEMFDYAIEGEGQC